MATKDFSITRNPDGGVTIEFNGAKAVLDAKTWCEKVAAAAKNGAEEKVLYLVQALHSGEQTIAGHLHLLAQRFMNIGHDLGLAAKAVTAPAPAADAKAAETGAGDLPAETAGAGDSAEVSGAGTPASAGSEAATLSAEGTKE